MIAVVMGSSSDWGVMKNACEMLEHFGIPWKAQVLSAHRMPGMLAAKTTLPVLGVPVPSGALNGQDALYSIVQMPKGVPVATFAIGNAGAANAALFAVSMLAVSDRALAEKLQHFREQQRETAATSILLTSEVKKT